MNNTLSIFEETLTGERTHSQTLDFLTPRITVRELIRAHIYEQVREAQLVVTQVIEQRVQPTQTERVLNGAKGSSRNLQQPKQIDWEKEADKALEGFARNRYFLLVGDRQVENLDEEIDLNVGTEVTFLKLIPLAGG